MFALRLNPPRGLSRHPGRSIGFSIGLGTLLLVLGGALGFRAAMVGSPKAVRNTPEPAASAIELGRGFAAIVRQVEGAVVNVNTEQTVHSAGTPPGGAFSDLFVKDTPFGSFFRRVPRDLKQRSLGSGFIVEPAGFILTNDHVVENASSIKVKLGDGRIVDASVVGTDPRTDIAVLKISASNLPALRLAKSDRVQVGDWVLAIGSPFGLEKTITVGIISAKGRVIGAGPFDDFLQTDAAINPGNSGGPLVNLEGEAVGINTMIANQSGGFQGVGFAIPSSMAEDVYHQITGSGKVTRGWLGIQGQEVTPEIAKSFNLVERGGVLLADVDPGSPAERGGLQSGDIILEFNGQQVQNLHELSLLVAGLKVGSPARIKILRKDQILSLNVTIGERPLASSESFRSSSSNEAGVLGITVESITPETQRQLNLASTSGALITDVRPGSAADRGGVQPGDVVHEANHAPVNRARDLVAVTRNLGSGSVILLKIERQGQTLFLAFELT